MNRRTCIASLLALLAVVPPVITRAQQPPAPAAASPANPAAHPLELPAATDPVQPAGTPPVAVPASAAPARDETLPHDLSPFAMFMNAHLNAFKPASPNGAGGTARVAFSVDRTGRVVSASLAGSSGDAALDEAAVAMVRRASPVPAPPPELGGRVSLAVPVRFH